MVNRTKRFSFIGLVAAVVYCISCLGHVASAPSKPTKPTKPIAAVVAVTEPATDVATAECTERPCIHVGAILGPITDSTAEQVSGFLTAASQKGVDGVVLVIASPGGDFDASEQIYDAIWASTVPVYCYVKDIAMSGAFWLLQSCKERAAEADARLMVHAPYMTAPAKTTLKRHNLVEMLSRLDMMQSIMDESISERMGITKVELDRRLSEGDWFMSASDAQKNKAIDVVVPKSTGMDGYIASVVEKLRNQPEVKPRRHATK